MIKTNKVLTVLLVVAIVFSIGTMINALNRLDSLKIMSQTIKESTLTIGVSSYISITTSDSGAIHFGSCKILETEEGYFTITSEGTHQTHDSCYQYQRNNISVRNNGNTNAMVYINTNRVGEAQGGSFLESPSLNVSEIYFKNTNTGRKNNQGGCTTVGLNYEEYILFEEEFFYYLICGELLHGAQGEKNSIVTDFKIVIPEDVMPGFASAQITFLAVET